jgi:tetratricopeptide (TPR) repeat protein
MAAPRLRDPAVVAALSRRIDPADSVALTNFAWLVARAGHLEAGLRAARRAASLEGAPRASWRALERLAIGRTDGLVLATVSQTPVTADGEDHASRLAAAIAAHRRAALAVAEACYHAALADPTQAASASNGLAVLHEQRGELEAADAAWQQAMEVPAIATIHNRALAWLRRGDRPRGRELLATHWSLVTTAAPLLFLEGYAALLDGDLASAREATEAALDLDPDLARAQFTLGLIYERLDRHADALAAIRRALLMSPWYLPQVWLLHPGTDAPVTELAAGEDHVGETTTSEDVLLSLGRSLLEAGHLGEALAVFDQVLLRRPAHTRALFHRGVVLAKLRRYAEALEDWQVVQEHDEGGTLASASARHAVSARRLADLFSDR